MATWRGQLQTAQLVRVSPTRRALVLNVEYAILDGGQVQRPTFPMQLSYRARTFRGMNLAQAWNLVLNTGADGNHSLMAIGARLLADWEDGDVIRTITPNQVFGP